MQPTGSGASFRFMRHAHTGESFILGSEFYEVLPLLDIAAKSFVVMKFPLALGVPFPPVTLNRPLSTWGT